MNIDKVLEKMTFEDAMNELENIVNALDKGDISLDKAIAAYDRGSKLKDHCEKKLNEAYPQITLVINPGSTNGSSLSQKESIKSEEKRKQTESEFINDDGLKELQEVFNSQVDVKSIKSIKESDNV